MDKPKTVQLRKWHFLFVGSLLVFLAAFLWYWNWRTIGLPRPLRPEHYLTCSNLSGGDSDAGFVYLQTDESPGDGFSGVVDHCQPGHGVGDGLDLPQLPVFFRSVAAD
jgi:hypothetical protein